MIQSEAIDLLSAAMVAAQGEIDAAQKDAKNDHFRSKYATLGSVWDACKPALQKHDLAVLQFPEPSDSGRLNLTTMLLHKSGQFIGSTQTMDLAKADPQGLGSGMTYARRYGLASLLGIVADEDDDGEAAMGRGRRQQEQTPPPMNADSMKPVEGDKPLRQFSGPRHADKPAGTADNQAVAWFFKTARERYGLEHDAMLDRLSEVYGKPIHSMKRDLGDVTLGTLLDKLGTSDAPAQAELPAAA